MTTSINPALKSTVNIPLNPTAGPNQWEIVNPSKGGWKNDPFLFTSLKVVLVTMFIILAARVYYLYMESFSTRSKK